MAMPVDRNCFSCGRIFPSFGARKCPICRAPEVRPPASPRRLSFREQQLAELVAQAKCDKQIAAALGLMPGTVKEYMHRMHDALAGKLLERNRVALAIWWITQGRAEYSVQTSAKPEAA